MIHKFREHGFTVIELVVVVTLIGILTTIVLLGLSTVGRQTNVEAVGDAITATLREAQTKASSGEGQSRWGVRFDFPASSTHSYHIFKGNDSTTGSSSGKKTLPSNFSFGGASDVTINNCTTESSGYCDVVFSVDGTTANYGTGEGDSVIVSVFHDGVRVDIVVTQGGLLDAKPPTNGDPDLPECRDGVDNDLDGKTDFSGADPGCTDANDQTESPDPGWSSGGDILSGKTARKIAHATGNDGLPMIAFVNWTDSNVSYIKCHSLACTGETPVILEDSGVQDGDVSLRLNTSGNPVIMHALQNSTPKVTICQNVECSTKTTNSVGDAGWLLALDLENDDTPRLGYYRTQGNDQHAYFGVCTDAGEDCSPAPVFTQIDSIQSGIGMAQKILNGISHFVHYEVTGDRLLYNQCDGSSSICGSRSILESGLGATSYEVAGIGVASDGNPIVAWNNNKTSCGAAPNDCYIKLLHCNLDCTNTGNAVKIDGSASARRRWPSLVVGSDTKPRLAWNDFTNGTVRYAQCANSSCSSFDESPANVVNFGGTDTSEPAPIALALYQNNPRIVYYDNFNNKLRIIWR